MTEGLGAVRRGEHPFEQIAAQLREQITTGALAPGAKLPSETQLRDHYGVARETVRRALALLAEDGLIETRVGSGSFVAERKRTR